MVDPDTEVGVATVHEVHIPLLLSVKYGIVLVWLRSSGSMHENVNRFAVRKHF